MITPADLAGWMDIPTTPALTEAKAAALQVAIDAAVEEITDRCIPLGEPDDWVGTVRLAAIMQAAKWYKRKGSPEGVAGWGDLGVIRIRGLDPDVETMLSRKLKFEFA